jgi:hypothetical protein
MAVPGLRVQVESGQRAAEERRRTSGVGPQQNRLRAEVGFYGFRGRNPILRKHHMYTGTLIADLMSMAERVTNSAEQQMKEELHEIFTMQILVGDGDQVYQGAA